VNPKSFTVLGITIDVNPMQSRNTPAPIDYKPSFNVIEVNFPQ